MIMVDLTQALAAPHTAHRSMIVEEGAYKALGIPIKLSRTPGTARSMPRALGADTREVCRQAGFGR
jgi:crotonobetainyl-CoA:carnitine CoA-transferase CaiB-like acyl-CoA transferase